MVPILSLQSISTVSLQYSFLVFKPIPQFDLSLLGLRLGLGLGLFSNQYSIYD